MKLLAFGTAAVLALLMAGTAEARFRGNHMVAACGPMVVQDAPLPRNVGVRMFQPECRVVVNNTLGMDESARCTLLIHARMALSGRGWLPVRHVSRRCLTPWEQHLKPDAAPSQR